MDQKYGMPNVQSRRKCCGVGRDERGRRRCCCCPFWCGCIFFTLLTAIIIVVVVLAIIIATAKVPDIKVLGVSPVQQGAAGIRQTGDSLAVDMNLRISVDNPNVMGFSLKQVDGTGHSPLLPGVNIANGSLSDVDIPKHSNQVINFPFTVTFSTSTDPNGVILKDVVTKCGLTGQAKQPIPIAYSVKAKVRVLIVNVNVPYDGSTTYDCPIPDNFQNQLIQQAINGVRGTT